jgi:hypothetical protein
MSLPDLPLPLDIDVDPADEDNGRKWPLSERTSKYQPSLFAQAAQPVGFTKILVVDPIESCNRRWTFSGMIRIPFFGYL